MPTRKPSQELLERAEEFYGTLMAWTHFNVAKFAEQIVREAAEIANTEEIDKKPENCSQCWDGFRLHRCSYHEGYDDAAATVSEAILRKFGLKH